MMATRKRTELLTSRATVDDLTDQDYRDIYDELRHFDELSGRYGVSLDDFVTLVTSVYSKALWSKYHRGEMGLNRTMRNELRQAVGLRALPLTVAEATATASPDAEVWQVGEGAAERVLLVALPSPLTLTLNGVVRVVDAAEMPRQGDVTGVTRRRERRAVSLPAALFERLNTARMAAGLEWSEFLLRLVEDGR